VTWPTLLRSAGQPQARERAWSWCVKGTGNAGKADVAELSPGGRVELVGSTASGRSVRGVKVGAARKNGLHVRKAGKVAYVTYAKGGRVRAVGVTTAKLAKRPKTLRAAVRRLLRVHASQAPRIFVPSAATASTQGRLTGVTLAGTGNPKLDAAIARLCHLQAGV
jgi:hypothetical protein